MLQFLGSGSAFNPKRGSNSAFYKEGDTLFVIDCGPSVFNRLLELGLLKDVKHINIFISHMHSDHIGSLGDLIFYAYYVMFNQFKGVTLYHHEDTNLDDFLEITGVRNCMWVSRPLIDDRYMHLDHMDVDVTPVEQSHSDNIKCHGLIIETVNGTVYYSADGSKIPDNVIHDLLQDRFSHFYQDVSSAHYEGNVHLSLYDLYTSVPSTHRHLVHCMHIDGQMDIEGTKELGFNVVENYQL